MEITLAPSWILSTEHSASSYGQPVLVKRATGEAFGPRDVVKLYPSHGYAPAAEGVARLAKTADLDVDGLALVARFLALAPSA